jgi:hypothetical protein
MNLAERLGSSGIVEAGAVLTALLSLSAVPRS